MSIQNEHPSFKLLLKQVYSAHTTKIKELENEIKVLKEKLSEKERERNTFSECKRCTELEAAFKSCKKALHDQSKLFESFGQKFSIFNNSELGTQEIKSSSKLPNCTSETDRFDRSLKNNKTFYERNESPLFSLEDNTLVEDKTLIDKVPVISSNQNLLKKFMCDDGNLESLDACTVTFPENLKNENIVCNDSLILVPDSLDTSPIDKVESKDKPKDRHSNWHKNKKTSNDNCDENLREIKKNHSEIKVSNKRLSDSVNEENPKRCNTGNQVETGSSKITKTKDDKHWDFQEPKIVVPDNSKQAQGKTKTVVKESSAKICPLTKQKTLAAEVVVSKDTKNEVPRNSRNNVTNDSKNRSNRISPSLLPKTVNELPKLIHFESLSNDDDFQELAPAKSIESEDSWDTCDKKKLRKNRLVKSIKTTSKYKMSLEAPSLNYKKPNYKQTKLPKDLFKPKEVESNQQPPTSNQDIDIEMIEDNPFPTVLKDHFQTSTQYGLTKPPFTFDIDATYIPENFKFESLHCPTSSVKRNAVEKSNFKNGGLFSNISFPEELNPSVKYEDGSENEINDQSSHEDAELKENVNSFDRIPFPEEPNYKYKNDVVRKKSERKQLNGFDCKECEKYYSELGLTDKEKRDRMKKCSRHRGKFTPPGTPEHFWELDFPDTEECKARGYMNETINVKLNNICNI